MITRISCVIRPKGLGDLLITRITPSMGGPLLGVFGMMPRSRTASSALFRVMYADAIRSQIQRPPR